MVLNSLIISNRPYGDDRIDPVQLSDVTVLVGPNNVGKSQTLRDVRDLMLANEPHREEAGSVILSSLTFSDGGSFENIIEELTINPDPDNDRVYIVGQEDTISMDTRKWSSLQGGGIQLEDGQRSTSTIRSALSGAMVSFIDAKSRLEIATNTKNQGNRNNPDSILEAVYFREESLEKELRDAFQQTFDKDLILDYSKGSSLRIVVGDNIGTSPDRPAELGNFIAENELSPLDDEGDGYISFVGVIASILLSKGKILLLDEPAAFLHPPQARSLGNWIAERSEDMPGQLIIATHNGSFLSGLLDRGDDVAIYRLNRPDMDTSFHEMSPRVTRKLSEDPLLSSQRIVHSVFHEGVIVCEGGEDRTVYQSVASTRYDDQDILFIDAMGKHVVDKIVSSVADANIPVAAILDLDVFNKRDILKPVLKSSPHVKDHDDIKWILDTADTIDSSLESEEPWKNGIGQFHADERNDIQKMIDEMAKFGIFTVHSGELESWMSPELGSETWLEAVLKEINEGNCDEDLDGFIGGVLEYLQKEYQRYL